jgi:DNA sulfur modification protein DndC
MIAKSALNDRIAPAVSDLRYCLSHLPLSSKIRQALEVIRDAYESDHEPWVVGYSGGKDSSCVLKLLFHALCCAKFYHKPVTVLYCDTGVEIPVAVDLAQRVLQGFRSEAASFGLPISIRVVSPSIKQRFFVKVIGRGYPPPTDKFRWCTDRLRIEPVTRILRERHYTSSTIVLGVRQNESGTRSLTLKQNRGDSRYWRRQHGHSDRRLFTPIIDFDIRDVWQTLLMLKTPRSVLGEEVATIYANASGECPTIRDPQGAPCGKARFGCWTCTVAKNGTTLRHLIASGSEELLPLLEFRLWLDKHRNNPRFRWRHRRNGAIGLGPMTMSWRRLALNKLLAAQRRSGIKLLPEEELVAIRHEWSRE